jgi:hypothetical protein
MNNFARAAFVSLVAATLLEATAPPRSPAVAFPWFVMFRGPGIVTDVVLGHSGVTFRDVRGTRMSVLGRDPLAVVYSTLQETTAPALAREDSAARIEVAEFFGTEWAGLTDSLGRPTRPLRFEEAPHHSYIYRGTPARRPVWAQPVVGPNGRDGLYFILSDSAARILARLGVRVD